MDEHETIIERYQRERIEAMRQEINHLRERLGKPPLSRFGESTRRTDGSQER